MLSLRQPTAEQMTVFLQRQNSRGFSYDAVGATAKSPPAGYFVSHTRVQLGSGAAAFDAAVAAIKGWQQFDLGWVGAHPASTPIRAGEPIAVLAHLPGVWSLNPCRIVYVIDEHSAGRKFGFAYGTLPDHAARGEERFLVEIDADENVWYDIFAFSQVRHLLAKIGLPLFRASQKKFARGSAEAMQRVVRQSAHK